MALLDSAGSRNARKTAAKAGGRQYRGRQRGLACERAAGVLDQPQSPRNRSKFHNVNPAFTTLVLGSERLPSAQPFGHCLSAAPGLYQAGIFRRSQGLFIDRQQVNRDTHLIPKPDVVEASYQPRPSDWVVEQL